MNDRKKICHITTVHPRYDVRIFYKECRSLAEKYDVYLIVADGKGNEKKDGVNIIDIGLRQKSRLKRLKTDSLKAFKKAVELDCEIYHFHDPELIKTGLKLKRKGKKVIYDVHEDLPRQIFGKPYLKSFLKPVLSFIIEKIENYAAKRFDYTVTATPFIRDRFLKINKNTVDINNFPVLSDFYYEKDKENKEKAVCYVGGISENRGVFELIESLKISKIKLHLAGKFENGQFEEKCKKSEGWKFVEYHGFVSRKEIAEITAKSLAGLVTLYPLRNYLDSLPVKMFEYMSAGLPVIASDFEYWKKIIYENNCGICVNPYDVEAIAEAIKNYTENPEKAAEIGKNGRKAAENKYNWGIEKQKLSDIYNKILDNE